MVIEVGHFCLILAAVLSALQAGFGFRHGYDALVHFAARLQWLLILTAFIILTHSFIVSDFSLLLVADHSSTTAPLLYRVTAVWGNHEGSMLLWLLVLTIYGAMVSFFGKTLPSSLIRRVLAVQALIVFGFAVFIIITSNPFVRLELPPLEGLGLNPILQDPGLAFHPPLLYLGYVGLSIPFSFAMAALLEARGEVDWLRAWASWVRPWAMVSWCFLTLGIALGSYWAYYTLGWGGWWFWDPVENAALLPWLVATALLHSARVVEVRGALQRWTILLAIIAFGLSLLGTFLVRSGVLTSVHAFAVDPSRGIAILLLLGITIGGGLLLFALRAPYLRAGPIFTAMSREGSLVFNNLLLASGAATVLVGTLYPLILDGLGAAPVSVGPPYYISSFLPLMVPMVVAMGLAPLLDWRQNDFFALMQRLRTIVISMVAVALAAALVAAVTHPGNRLLAMIGAATAVWVFIGTIVAHIVGPNDKSRYIAWGRTLAHLGMAITILGMTGTSYRQELSRVMKTGDQATLGPFEIVLDRFEKRVMAGYDAELAVFAVKLRALPFGIMANPYTVSAEHREFKTPVMTTSVTGILSLGFGDIYIALGDKVTARNSAPVPDAANAPIAPNGYVVRLYWTPLIPLIWIGTLFMAVGGAIAIMKRRTRHDRHLNPAKTAIKATARGKGRGA